MALAPPEVSILLQVAAAYLARPASAVELRARCDELRVHGLDESAVRHSRPRADTSRGKFLAICLSRNFARESPTRSLPARHNGR